MALFIQKNNRCGDRLCVIA